MRTIRRLYVYMVAFISLEVIIWGVIGLVRSLVGERMIGSEVALLAGALSLIAVGIPVFLLHWWIAQRKITDDEENFARLRAVFIYGTLLATLIPITQNVLSLINRVWLRVFQLPLRLAFLGEGQSWVDNLIAIVINGLIALYMYSVLRKNWEAVSKMTSQQGKNFPETRRLYRYIWVIYGLAMVVGGVQQVLNFILNLAETIGQATSVSLANGLTLLIVGTPLWIYVWQIVQNSLNVQDEVQSSLRLVILYILNLIGVGGVLVPLGLVLSVSISLVLGESMTPGRFLTEISNPLSTAIPFGVMWLYYGRIMNREVSALNDITYRASLQRLYQYILSLIGLTAAFLGLNGLLSFIIDILIEIAHWSINLRSRLSGALSTLIIGLPLWIINWRLILLGASQEGELGDHARRSLIRKVYLYLVLFVSVIGVMISAGSLLFQLLSKLLGSPPDGFQRTTWLLLELLILFSALLTYHLAALRSDNRLEEQALAARHAAFPVLILVSEIGKFSEEILKFLNKEIPSLPAAIHTSNSGVPDETLSEAKAVILPGEVSANPSEAIRLWIQGFSGTKLVVPTETDSWLWSYGSGRSISSLAQQTAKIIRHLAEGQAPPKFKETSPWMVIVYIVAGLISIPLLVGLFSILAELLN